MSRKKKKYDKLVEMCIKIPFGIIIGFIVAIIILGKESYNCQQALKEPKHCLDVCADQLLRFENRGLITIHCQKCTTKGDNNE